MVNQLNLTRRDMLKTMAGLAALTATGNVVFAEESGGHLVIGLSEDWMVMDPHSHFYITAWGVHAHFYEALLEQDTKGNFVPLLAESWRSIDDRSWEFKLRKGVKFHNGEPFTATSVKFSLERIIAPDYKSPQKGFLWDTLEGVDVVDDHTAVVRTKDPYAPLLANLSWTGILPAEAGQKEGFFSKPAGTGAFKFTRWLKGDRLETEANPDWWGGKPALSKITFRYIREQSTRMASVLVGETHVVDNLPAESIAQFENNKNAHIENIESVQYMFVAFNCSHKPLDDVRVRQAFNYAIDVKSIVDNILLKQAVIADAPMASSVPAYTKHKPYSYDPDKAKKLLSEAGYGNGMRKLDILLLKGLYTKGLEVTQAVVGDLKKIGINVVINDLELALSRKRRAAGEYDLFYTGWSCMTGDADFSLFRNFMTGNLWRYDNKDVMALLYKARQTLDREKRKEVYAKIQAILWEECPWVWLYNPLLHHGVNNKVTGVTHYSNNAIVARDASLG